MPKNIPSLKPKELIRILKRSGCAFHRQGKGDHQLYLRHLRGRKRIVLIDMGAGEFAPAYVLRILRQFDFTDHEIEDILK